MKDLKPPFNFLYLNLKPNSTDLAYIMRIAKTQISKKVDNLIQTTRLPFRLPPSASICNQMGECIKYNKADSKQA
jgi:hypothetical protein